MQRGREEKDRKAGRGQAKTTAKAQLKVKYLVGKKEGLSQSRKEGKRGGEFDSL